MTSTKVSSGNNRQVQPADLNHPPDLERTDEICLYGGSIMWTRSRFGVIFLYLPQTHEVSETAWQYKKTPHDVNNTCI